MATMAAQKGSTDPDIRRLVAENILLPKPTEKHPREAEALLILRELIEESPNGDCESSHILGRFYTHKYFFQPEATVDDFERGVSHLVLHGGCPSAVHWLGMGYAFDKKTRNIPKALAALHRAVEINTGAWKKAEQGLQKKLLKEASAAQRKEAESLILDKWPYDRKHRKKAFQSLQKFGDISADKKFDPALKFPDEIDDL